MEENQGKDKNNLSSIKCEIKYACQVIFLKTKEKKKKKERRIGEGEGERGEDEDRGVEEGMRLQNTVLFTYYSHPVHCSEVPCSAVQCSKDTWCRHLEQNGTVKGKRRRV